LPAATFGEHASKRTLSRLNNASPILEPLAGYYDRFRHLAARQGFQKPHPAAGPKLNPIDYSAQELVAGCAMPAAHSTAFQPGTS
jgi:hypothetical protein